MILSSLAPSPSTHMPRRSFFAQQSVFTAKTTTTTTTTTTTSTTTSTTMAATATRENGKQKRIGGRTTKRSYWSDCSQGSVPSGAVAGGRMDGKVLYIVRASYAGGFCKSWYYRICQSIHFVVTQDPSGAFAASTSVYFGYCGRTITISDFQCLIADSSHLRWVPVSGPCTVDKVGTNPVEGGWEVDGTRFLIAQVTVDGGDMHVGKVKWNDCAYIACSNGDQKYENYSVLVFT
ncbi:hypothetical protein BD769DRAFT_1446965 [Suillus cothurnatus]|nr:hypothetical protein BD769DRAFT_1446965 [Suillus cothurnatus]